MFMREEKESLVLIKSSQSNTTWFAWGGEKNTKEKNNNFMWETQVLEKKSLSFVRAGANTEPKDSCNHCGCERVRRWRQSGSVRVVGSCCWDQRSCGFLSTCCGMNSPRRPTCFYHILFYWCKSCDLGAVIQTNIISAFNSLILF